MPFTLLLPALALLVWVGIVATPAARMYLALKSIAQTGKSATVTVGAFHATIVPESFAAFAVNYAVVTHSHALTAMDLPGAFMEMPISLATTRPAEWYPRRLDLWTGRALTMPIYCLPAWWLVGLGLDALLGRRRVRWPGLVLGSVLCGLFVVMLGGFLSGVSVSNGAGGGWVFAGLGLWIALFAMLPVAWVKQRRVRSEARA